MQQATTTTEAPRAVLEFADENEARDILDAALGDHGGAMAWRLLCSGKGATVDVGACQMTGRRGTLPTLRGPADDVARWAAMV